MADTSDYIPTNGIRFDEAFERFFDADPRATELRTKIDRVIEAEVSGPEYDDTMDEWDIVRTDLDLFFRQELSNGALVARRRDPYTGEEQKVPPKDWEGIAILPGADLEFPPSFFLEAEFEPWLRKVRGASRKSSPSLDRARRALTEKFGDPIPDTIPRDVSNTQLEGIVSNWCRNQGLMPKDWPSETHIRRAAGRRR
jgi:hypothetical protein